MVTARLKTMDSIHVYVLFLTVLVQIPGGGGGNFAFTNFRSWINVQFSTVR